MPLLPSMHWLERLLPQAWHNSFSLFIGLTLACALLLCLTQKGSRKAVLRTLLLLLLSLLVLNIPANPELVSQLFLILMGLTLIRLWAMLLIRLLLPLLRLHPPRILEDIVIVLGAVAWGLVLLRLAGLDLSHIVTTSAVITAVLAFSMQDTLGNLLAGLSLQFDNSVEVGDWIKLEDLVGKVVEINWRATLVETRNWETVVIPNSALMKGHFALLGKRQHQPVQWRRWVWFSIHWDTLPTQIISVVESALQEAQLPGVASSPAPNCVLMGFENGYSKYALRYWLSDLAADDLTDSIIRTHIDAALRRHNLRLALPHYSLLTTKENEKYLEARVKKHLDERVQALRKVELLSSLSEEEMLVLADQLKFSPFVSGDIILHQGAEGHCLYILLSGEVEVWLEHGDGSKQLIDVLQAGQFFGEMGLMTGEARSGTVLARSNVECLRLDKEAFQAILSSRKELAETISAILVQRLAERQQKHSQDHLSGPVSTPQRAELLEKMRRFFGLSKSGG